MGPSGGSLHALCTLSRTHLPTRQPSKGPAPAQAPAARPAPPRVLPLQCGSSGLGLALKVTTVALGELAEAEPAELIAAAACGCQTRHVVAPAVLGDEWQAGLWRVREAAGQASTGCARIPKRWGRSGQGFPQLLLYTFVTPMEQLGQRLVFLACLARNASISRGAGHGLFPCSGVPHSAQKSWPQPGLGQATGPPLASSGLTTPTITPQAAQKMVRPWGGEKRRGGRRGVRVQGRRARQRHGRRGMPVCNYEVEACPFPSPQCSSRGHNSRT